MADEQNHPAQLDGRVQCSPSEFEHAMARDRHGARDVTRDRHGARDVGRATVWCAVFGVVLAAGAATAHGLFEVARAATVEPGIAWLYPVITDGLALVAYVATSRLCRPHARAYAWSVVVLAAGLSGLAQAAYLAGGVATASPALRFGVGAWPAIAAALAAHLLFLLTHTGPPHVSTESLGLNANTGGPDRSPDWIGRPDGGVQIDHATAVQPGSVDHPAPGPAGPGGTAGPDAVDTDVQRGGLSRVLAPRVRAIVVAQMLARQAGALPSVRQLAGRAQVSHGTAATALQELREGGSRLRLVPGTTPGRPETDEQTDESGPEA
jgi:hypothetical protein